MSKKFYPDKTFYPQIEEFKTELTFRINSYEDLWYLRQVKDVYDANNKSLSVLIPCLLDAQADRRFNLNESANLKLVCEFINSMKFEKVKVFHPHNAEVVEALIDKVEIIDNYKFISDVLDYIENDNLILMSTDAGGFKPLMKLSDKLKWNGEVFSATKSRIWNSVNHKSELIQRIDREDFEGKDVLIIDDLCVFGGTFMGLSNLLAVKNIGKLYLAVSHITVQNPNIKLNEFFDQIYTTNSKYEDYDNLLNLTVLKHF